MERRDFGKARLVVPTDFTQSAAARGNIPEDLVPPSHFTSRVHSTQAQRSVKVPVTPPPISWINPEVSSVLPADCGPANPWLALSQAQQEILELKKENQRILMLQGEHFGGATSADHLSELRSSCRATQRSEQWSRLESQWQMEAEKRKAEAGRLKEQVEALKETVERCREEIRDKDTALIRHSHEMEVMCEELSNTKTELSQVREELSLSSVQKEKISSQLKASYCAELDTAARTNTELQERLQSITSEVLQLKSSLMEVSAERDGLKEHLSQMGRAFETQSATLHSLRNYIGQLAPEKGEKEQLNKAVEKLSKEKEALLTTTELLTVRLNSLNEILALQEEKLMKKISPDPHVKNGCEGCQVLQLWREKVFKLCIQLRFKDIELRREKEDLLSKVRSIEQELQQEQHRSTVLQHSLRDRIAELDLERIEKKTFKEDLAKVDKENTQLRSQSQKAEAECKTLTEAIHRFSQTFENKVAEVAAAKTRLSTFTQRLTFAQRRVETIQALVMRRAALQKVEQACKQTEEAEAADRKLQIEHTLVCEERDRLSQELKRTPELIDKALAELKHQYESKVKQQQQELEQSRLELQQSEADREDAEQSLQQIRDQLEESKVNLEKLRCEMLSQQALSKQALKERVSEIEDQCAEKLREMEVQVNTARREHTKAVRTLRQFEREAARSQDEMKENTKRDVANIYPADTEIDKNPLLVTSAQRGLHRDFARPHTAAPQNFAAFRKYRRKPPERSCSAGTKDHQASDVARLHPVRETAVCFGGAPRSQCCSGKQLGGLCGGGGTE
ncbi:coiled-coil alpha-helical rod protein 1 isoform X2 [Salarias fasciatus]|uniref:coiled-coil alpha-helical rod protein 1 isoform X2 n=1 Tax=Salarias fasciatus TaxID=181472 RepID=UPI001176AC5F|nr:coiled-coil alpha-helical rod protein 1 isoform X2 [Salarias fasciatus]